MKSFIIKIGFIIIVAMILSCDADRLDTPPQGLTEETFFKEENDFRLALMNAYAKMIDWYWFRAGDADLHAMYHLLADDITEDNGRYNTWEIFANINPNNGDISYYWEKTYELIQRTNVIIEKTRNADPAEFDDPTFLEYNLGEGLFLRALANYYLYNRFGTAPVITERLGSGKTNTPRSEGTQLLDQVITDLQEAANLLPDSWDAENVGRATKNAAYGLLAKSLVFRADYTGNTSDYSAAIQAFNNISGRSLTEDYTDNFNGLTENNEESLFEYQASFNGNNDNVWLYNDGPWRGVETMSTFWGFFTVVNGSAKNNFQGTTWKVTEKFMDNYGDDPRIAFFTEEGRAFTKYGKEGLDAPTPNRPSSLNNIRLLRLADVKLHMAEAILKSGGSKSEAIGMINEVRERARNWAIADTIVGETPELRDVNETDNAVIMDWIMEERAIEFCGENDIRWFDLKRWDATGDVNLANWDGGDQYFSTDLSANFQFEYPKNLLLPIPQEEIERNSAITSNNPGY